LRPFWPIVNRGFVNASVTKLRRVVILSAPKNNRFIDLIPNGGVVPSRRRRLVFSCWGAFPYDTQPGPAGLVRCVRDVISSASALRASPNHHFLASPSG